jgi:hypothetical protein
VFQKALGLRRCAAVVGPDEAAELLCPNRVGMAAARLHGPRMAVAAIADPRSCTRWAGPRPNSTWCYPLDCGTFLMTVRGRRFVAATVGARLRHVIIEVSHPSLVEDLLEFLRSSSCEAMRCGGQTVDVRAGWPLSEGGQRHLDLYLAAWEAKNPGARAVRVG